MHTYSNNSEVSLLVDTNGFMCDTINLSNQEMNIMNSFDFKACATPSPRNA